MNQDYPLDPADTIPIRRFVKLRPFPKAGERVYRTDAYSPIELFLENGFMKLGKSREKPDRLYLRAPNLASTSPFPVTALIPNDEAILALAAEVTAKCAKETWSGRFGSWHGCYSYHGAGYICGMAYRFLDEERLRRLRAPRLLLFTPQVWSVTLRWPDGFDKPVWDRDGYVSHLEYIKPEF